MMKSVAGVFVILAAIAYANGPLPYYAEIALLDRISALARPGSPVAPTALSWLESIAEGRPDEANSDLEAKLGLQSQQLRRQALKLEQVRSHAMERIGDVLLPDALTYLLSLDARSVGPDTTGMVWSAAQVALRHAQMIRIPDDSGKTRFLEDATGEESAAVATWAVDELCNRGSIQSLGFITESIMLRDHTRGARKVAFCRARIEVVCRNPDRAKALGSILSVSSNNRDEDLVAWAMRQLDQANTSEADAELERYAHEIEALPNASPLRSVFWGDLVAIRELPRHSPK